MNAPVTIPTLSLDDLLRTTSETALPAFTHTPHLQPAGAQLIAARAIQGAIDDWCWENHMPAGSVCDALVAIALARLIDAGWAAREARDVERALEEEAMGPVFVRAQYMGDAR